MYKHKWKPSVSQRKAFAEKMKDPEEQAAYNERKESKSIKRRTGSNFSYQSAGGNYIPTQHQYNGATQLLFNSNLTEEQKSACNQVMYGYGCNEKIHHDNIHIVNEMMRNTK